MRKIYTHQQGSKNRSPYRWIPLPRSLNCESMMKRTRVRKVLTILWICPYPPWSKAKVFSLGECGKHATGRQREDDSSSQRSISRYRSPYDQLSSSIRSESQEIVLDQYPRSHTSWGQRNSPKRYTRGYTNGWYEMEATRWEVSHRQSKAISPGEITCDHSILSQEKSSKLLREIRWTDSPLTIPQMSMSPHPRRPREFTDSHLEYGYRLKQCSDHTRTRSSESWRMKTTWMQWSGESKLDDDCAVR